jgi:hypothetical protein
MADKQGRKTGGRKKGVPNKDTLNLEERLRELKFDPVAELIVALSTQPPYQQVDSILKMWEFLYPKRKQMELSSSPEGFKLIIEDYRNK